MRPVRAVVLGLLVCASLGFGPSLKRWQTLALPPKLIDSSYAVGIRIVGARQRRGLAVGDRSIERAVAAISLSAATRAAGATRTAGATRAARSAGATGTACAAFTAATRSTAPTCAGEAAFTAGATKADDSGCSRGSSVASDGA
jgi:hypothetical protein